jgi:GNAT superfamily N-acetyltransferase
MWRSLHTTGFMRTVQRALQRFVPVWAFDMNRMAVCEVDLTEWQGAKPDPQWNYRLATPEDAELLMSRGLSRFEVDRFFDCGAFGSVLEIDGQLIANNWAIPNHWACFDWIGFELEPDEIYGASSFVAPAYRGQRIHHQTRSFMYGQMAALGYRRAITLIEVLNKSSLKASAHKPRKYHGFLSYVRLLGLIVYKLNGKWGVGFWNQKRPLALTYRMLKADQGTETGRLPVSYPRRTRRPGGIRISEGWRREIRARKTRVQNQRSVQNAP